MSSGTTTGELAETPPERPAEQEYATRDQLRAMAHPLRLEIMERVGRRGTARAADIAADLGLPANSVSYHLRILARGGVIEEAPEAARDRRDRVWRLVQVSFNTGRQDGHSADDADSHETEYLDASGATALAAFEWMRSAWSAEIARSHATDGSPANGLGTMHGTSMRLSQEQMRELNDLVSTKIQEYSRLNRDAHGADLPGDPDSDGEALTYRALWVTVGEQSAKREDGRSARRSGD